MDLIDDNKRQCLLELRVLSRVLQSHFRTHQHVGVSAGLHLVEAVIAHIVGM